MKIILPPKNPSITYGFVRARQLEGTFPGEPGTGVWPITGERIAFGWGLPPEDSWPRGSQWPPREPPNLDAEAKKYRMGRYQRVRTLDECRKVMGSERPLPVLVSLDITERWGNAPNGEIPALRRGDVFVGSHSVLLVGYDDSKGRLTFQNSWGIDWGDKGFGYIDYETFETSWCEGWVSDFIGSRDDSPKEPPGFKRGAWGLREFGGGMFHCREFIDPSDERIGWLFAIERSDGIEVEEWFVRPAFRRKGYGKWLIRLALELAESKGLRLRVWISHADTNPSNLQIVEKLVHPLGLEIRDSFEPWAPFTIEAGLGKGSPRRSAALLSRASGHQQFI
ncbi:MAG TPA: GNAT family N-acetyltransferase [Terriglobales bacterium]|nr:GNAT family N-acetyltransferase [Terriglobales bacterium]